MKMILKFKNSANKDFYVVLVGALIVGKIEIRDNQNKDLCLNQTYHKGDQIGYFTFGSTVIMLTHERLCDPIDTPESFRSIKARACF